MTNRGFTLTARAWLIALLLAGVAGRESGSLKILNLVAAGVWLVIAIAETVQAWKRRRAA